MRTISTKPETSMLEVADGDFSGLSQPLLVAAGTRKQFEDFMWENALVCSECRRVSNYMRPMDFPENKIMILLPGCETHLETAGVVERWVDQEDRYTVQLDYPRPCIEKDQRETWMVMCMIALAVGAVFAWLIFR